MTEKLRKNSISILFLLLTMQSTVTMDNRSDRTIYTIGVTVVCLSIIFLCIKELRRMASVETCLEPVLKKNEDDSAKPKNIDKNIGSNQPTYEQKNNDVQNDKDSELLLPEHLVFAKYMQKFEQLRFQLKEAKERTISTDKKEKFDQEWKQKKDIHEYSIKLLNIICKGIVSIHQDFKNRYVNLIKTDMLLFMDESYPDYEEIYILEKLFLLGCKYNDTEVFACMRRIIKKALTPYDRSYSHNIFSIFDTCLEVAYLYQSDEVINLLHKFKLQQEFDAKLQCRIDANLPYLDNATHIIKSRLNSKRYNEYDIIAHFFETKLRQNKEQENDFSIQELMNRSLKEDTDSQMLLFIMALKNNYMLLEATLQESLGLTFASKNFKNQTLYHVAYLWKGRLPSLKSIIFRLMEKSEIDINARDDENKTALQYALERCLCIYDNHDYRFKNKITKSYAFEVLLEHPSIDVNSPDKSFVCHSHIPTANLLLHHKTFKPEVVAFWYYLPFISAFDRDPYRGKIDLERFKTPAIATKQLQLIPHIENDPGNYGAGTFYDLIEQSVNECVNAGGSFTTPDESGYLPVHLAQRKLMEYKKSLNSEKEPTFYQRDGKELVRRKIVYDIYLIHTPNDYLCSYLPSKIYLYLVPLLNNDIAKNIALFYHNLTPDKLIPAIKRRDQYYNDKEKAQEQYKKTHRYDCVHPIY